MHPSLPPPQVWDEFLSLLREEPRLSFLTDLVIANAAEALALTATTLQQQKEASDSGGGGGVQGSPMGAAAANGAKTPTHRRSRSLASLTPKAGEPAAWPTKELGDLQLGAHSQTNNAFLAGIPPVSTSQHHPA